MNREGSEEREGRDRRFPKEGIVAELTTHL